MLNALEALLSTSLLRLGHPLGLDGVDSAQAPLLTLIQLDRGSSLLEALNHADQLEAQCLQGIDEAQAVFRAESVHGSILRCYGVSEARSLVMETSWFLAIDTLCLRPF